MTSELLMLLWGASSIAFIHTLLGPDHYLPFVAIGKARGWSLPRTAATTVFCGIGHSIGSILLGFVGIYVGRALADLEMVEAFRGDMAAWALLAFGLVYFVWGVRKSQTQKSHRHWHTHGDGTSHEHYHNHRKSHVHIHEARQKSISGKNKRMAFVTPWALFIIFVLGPCEPLIPLMMIPAAQGQWMGVVLTVGAFTLVTIATMTMVVVAASLGLKTVSFDGLGKYAHALAGGTLSLCGLGMITLGL